MSGKELFEGMSYVDERYVDEADCVILDLSSEATKPFCWNAYRIQGRSHLHNKRKVAIILLAAALMLALVSCGVAAVINVDSIQTWFSHYWKQITEQEMDTAQTAVIHELSQKIGQSVTDGALTITVDSATGSEDIFYILVRVEGLRLRADERGGRSAPHLYGRRLLCHAAPTEGERLTFLSRSV